jgi:hypothetical protein
MYAYMTTETPATPVDFKVKDAHRFFYWRKHPNLHGWMEQLYRDQGGDEDSFNCVPVVLTLDDLDRLEEAIKANELPHTSGFFFGESDGTEVDDDLAFVAKAREAIGQGLNVFYDSWW